MAYEYIIIYYYEYIIIFNLYLQFKNISINIIIKL